MTLTLNKFRNYAMVALATMALASCSNDDFMDDTPSLKAEGMATAPQGILPGVQPSNGYWVTSSFATFFDGYYKAQGNGSTPPNPLVLNQGIKVQYAPGGRAFNGYYYVLGNLSTGQRGIRKMKVSGGNLTDVKTLQTSSGSIQGQDDEVNFTLFDATTGYYTDGQGLSFGYIGKFNPSTMQTTGGFTLNNSQVRSKLEDAMNALNARHIGEAFTNVYISSYDGAAANSKRIGTKLLIRRGNYLYADITFGTGRNKLKQIKQSTNNVYVAVINVNTHNVEKVLIGENARNIGLFNDHPLVCIDPISKAIYFATVANMDKLYAPEGKAGFYSRIFRIADSGNSVPSSMTEVANYKDTNSGREGQFNTLYAYNDVIYTKIATEPVLYTKFGIHGQEYRKNIWEYVRISGGNVHKVKIGNGTEVLKDNFFAFQQPQLINGALYMISNSTNGGKVYKVSLGGIHATPVTVGNAGGFGLGLVNPNKIGSIVKL